MPAQLRITERRVGDVIILDLSGRLEMGDGDVELAAAIDTLLSRQMVNVVVNMRDVARIDSGGIGVLVAKFFGARRRGGDLKLLHLTDRTYHAVAVTRVLSVFERFDDESRAVASFESRG